MNNIEHLIDINPKTHKVLLALAYATTDNFTDQLIYQSPVCKLHKAAADNLHKAVELLEPLGLQIKIWDAWRPLEAQAALFKHTPDPMYVSHPETGLRPHCRGVAIDLTLVDKFGNELEMGSDFDDFRPLAHHGNDQVTETAQKNRLLLAGVMNVAGFDPFQSEWWHYQLPNAEQYPIITEAEAQTGIMQLQ